MKKPVADCGIEIKKYKSALRFVLDKLYTLS
jgi:hypothetical protein